MYVAPGTDEDALEIELRRWGDHQPSERIRTRAEIHIPSHRHKWAARVQWPR
jgi:hypothetical protein